ncbi:hypothetical protein ABPG75_003283 [Micractinium tetrahymenae]
MAPSEREEEQEAASDSEPEEEEEPQADSEPEYEPGGDEESGGGSGSDAASPTQRQLEERRQQNIRALVSGTGLALHRQALLPRLLTVQQAAVVLRRPFKCPAPGAPAVSQALKRKLAARKAFVPWGGGKFVPLKLKAPPRDLLPEAELPAGAPAAPAAAPAAPAVVLPPGVEPLVLWELPAGVEGQPVRVDDMLTQFLRPHQREGVQFMFECVTGLRSFQGQGCILADDMGLGKTLQGISLLWTLLSSPGHPLLGGEPIARRVIICCPTSLVGNWDSECAKWLKGRVRTLPLCESSRDEAVASISQFLSPRNPYQVMIVSYETFRIHAERFRAEGTCDLLICDEAHRLKNDATLTNRALDSLACQRRVLLSGTPLQNRLDEFYAMVSFCNPGVLGSPAQFRRHFEAPILAGREPDASEAEVALSQERTAELSALVNEFILRRTNTLLSQHLPPKVVEIVCCKLTTLQTALYCHFLESKATRTLFATQKAARVLSAITSLRKLLNHPKLIWDALQGSAARGEAPAKEAEGFEGCAAYFSREMYGGRSGRGGMSPGWELQSGKFAVLAGMLELLRTCTSDRIVIVSNYTQTLDLVAQLCRDRGYPYVRLDGTTTIKKRNKLVKEFNDQSNKNQFAFLLSSKAGGCGLNLIGGNRLVLFDPSWNPADDKQAAARVWRDGQQKKVYVYRFMAAGSIEEKVYQRQLSKEGLQQVVDSKAGGKPAGPNLMSMEELRDLFSYDPDTLSSTYDGMVCQRPAQPAAAGKADGRGGRGGRDKAAAAAKRSGGGGGARKRPKTARRRSAWSSSEEEDGGFEEEEDDFMISDSDEEEVIILDSEEEAEAPPAGAAGAAGPALAAGAGAAGARQQQQQQQGSDVVPASDSDGWTPSEDEGERRQQDAPMAPAEQQEQLPAGLPDGDEGGEDNARPQGPAQPLPPTQQAEEPEDCAAAAAGGGGGQQQQQQAGGEEQFIPTRLIKQQGGSIHKLQVGKPGEEQLRLWGHHTSTATVPDQVLQKIGDEHISFVFTLEVDGKAVDPEPPLVPLAGQQQQQGRGLARRAPAPAPALRSMPQAAGTAAASAAVGGAPAVAAAAQHAAVQGPVVAAPAAAAQQAAAPPAQQQQAGAAPPIVQQQQQQQSAVQPRPPQPAKENATANRAVTVQGSRLALPSRPKPSGPGPAKRPAVVAAVRQVVVASDSDDDFK